MHGKLPLPRARQAHLDQQDLLEDPQELPAQRVLQAHLADATAHVNNHTVQKPLDVRGLEAPATAHMVYQQVAMYFS